MQLNLEKELGDWYPLLREEFETQAVRTLGERLSTVVPEELCPALPDVFRALRLTAPQDVKVVVLGQDPYIAGEACGLAFSSGNGTMPYSLKIIFEELKKAGFSRTRVTLDDWAQQGVLLLNHTLTTIRGTSNAHATWGWHQITDKILRICYVNAVREHRPTVFMAWGSYAQKAMVRQGIRSQLDVRYLQGNHPAATRYGYIFRGAELFQEANRFLEINGVKPIQWGD